MKKIARTDRNMGKAYRGLNAYIYAVTGITVLAGTMLFSQNYTTHADNSAVDVVAITVPSSCTLGGVVDSAHNATILSGEYKQSIGQTTIKAFCNDSGGYIIFAIGVSGGIDGQTDLISAFNTNYNIHTGTATSGATSAWAMKLTAGTVTNATDGINATPPTIASDSNGSYASYHVVPNTYTMVAYRQSQTDMNADITASGSYLTTTYQVYANGAQPAGTYSGKVKYAMMHPYSSDTLKSIKMALDEAQGTETITKDGVQYYTMQSMTSAICNATTIIGEASQIKLIDKRDNNIYWVAKLEDGHCWMTQNLSLDLEATPTNVAALTSENTDLTTYGSKNYDTSNGYACSNPSTTTNCTAVNEVITWIPERGTIMGNNLNNTIWPNDNSNPYSYDSGVAVVDGDDSYDGHKYVGNYYNWTAAIASNNSGAFTSSTLNNVANNPQNSICPKGWRLPTIANNTNFPGTVAGSPNEFRRLNVIYNDNSASSATGLMNSPLYFSRSGYILNGTLSGPGTYGSYWSSTVNNSNYAYSLYLHSDGADPENYNFRHRGRSVRCVVR